MITVDSIKKLISGTISDCTLSLFKLGFFAILLKPLSGPFRLDGVRYHRVSNMKNNSLVMAFRSLFAIVITSCITIPLWAQSPDPITSLSPYPDDPKVYEILGISVEGVESDEIAAFVKQQSQLQVGQTVTVPGDPAFAEAIRSIYRTNMFSDVKISEERVVEDGLFLVIQVREEPRLANYSFEGVKKGHRDDLRKEVPLLTGARVQSSDIERAKMVIKRFFAQKGHMLAEVDVERELNESNNTVALTFNVDRGPRVEVDDIIVEGNEEISDRKIRKRLKKTKEKRWWRFWAKETFNESEFEEDLQRVLEYYNEKGYYDAQIVSDSVYLNTDSDEPELIVQLKVHEGPRYHIRNIEWEGNTVFSDQVLTQALGFEKGDVYNATKLQENLYANRASSDVMSLYTNQGYMRFNAQPNIQVVEGDSLDIHFDVFEGDVYEFGSIEIAGNQKTKEHVIRRELYTIPGQRFSREAIQESIRRLQQLSYFNAEALATGIGTNINEEEKTVDLTYKLEEVGSDQLELSGTWGRFGLVLMLRFGFNNFSVQNIMNKDAWRPLPSGDGQKLSLAIQTNGRYYQNYSVSFTEPWFRGRPTPIGFSVSHSRFSRLPYYYVDAADDNSGFVTTSARFFYDRRLKWPDDRFNMSSSIGYQYYGNNNLYSFLPDGVSQEVTLEQSLSRSSLDNPMFPMSGSQMILSLQVAPPLPGFIQYHKWRFKTDWNVPILPKVSLGFGTDFGYIGSLTGKEVKFERFDVGGSPFETQGFYNFGTDIIYMRGYPRSAIGPRLEGDAVGGTILNKFTSELRWLAVQSPQLSAAPYLFMDAANTWNDFSAYNPTQLYRSAGLGIRLFLPIVGMLELTYGYNFDEFVPLSGLSGKHDGSNRWYFQFSLGQGFNQ